MSKTGVSKLKTSTPEREKMLEQHATLLATGPLTREDRLTQIIQVCSLHGVKTFVNDQVSIEFFAYAGRAPLVTDVDASMPPAPVVTPPVAGVDPVVAAEPVVEAVDGEAATPVAVTDEVAEQIRLDELMVNDPAAFEQEMIDKHRE